MEASQGEETRPRGDSSVDEAGKRTSRNSSRSGSSRSSSRASKHRRVPRDLIHHYERTKRKLRYVIYGLLVCVVVAVITVNLEWTQNNQLAAENHALEVELRRLENEHAALQTRLEEARQEVSDLVKGRLPTLYAQEFDKVLTLERPYVRNIVFTKLRKGDEASPRIEYKVVLENEREIPVAPEISILVFDRLGIQIGMKRISTGSDDADRNYDGLEPNEITSHGGVIDLWCDREPEYFNVVVNESEPSELSGL